MERLPPSRGSGVRIPSRPPFSLPNWLLCTVEPYKGQIFGEIHIVLRGTGLQRIGFPVIRLNKTEFSQRCRPAVRFRRVP